MINIRLKAVAALGLYFSVVSIAFGDSRLCIPQSGVVLIEQSKTGNFTGNQLDFGDTKFIHSNESGKWQAKRFGSPNYDWDDCGEQGNFCELSGEWWGGFFNYNPKHNSFTALYMWASSSGEHPDVQHIFVGGKCSDI